jgi:hypothetical protein
MTGTSSTSARGSPMLPRKTVMKLSLVQRAVPLPVTTMLAASPAWAQAGPDANAPSGTSHKAMPHTGRSASAGRSGEAMQNLVECRIIDLHSRLHFTPEQSQQWVQFAQVIRDNARGPGPGLSAARGKAEFDVGGGQPASYAQLQQERAPDMQNYAANAQLRCQATAAL